LQRNEIQQQISTVKAQIQSRQLGGAQKNAVFQRNMLIDDATQQYWNFIETQKNEQQRYNHAYSDMKRKLEEKERKEHLLSDKRNAVKATEQQRSKSIIRSTVKGEPTLYHDMINKIKLQHGATTNTATEQAEHDYMNTYYHMDIKPTHISVKPVPQTNPIDPGVEMEREKVKQELKTARKKLLEEKATERGRKAFEKVKMDKELAILNAQLEQEKKANINRKRREIPVQAEQKPEVVRRRNIEKAFETMFIKPTVRRHWVQEPQQQESSFIIEDYA